MISFSGVESVVESFWPYFDIPKPFALLHPRNGTSGDVSCNQSCRGRNPGFEDHGQSRSYKEDWCLFQSIVPTAMSVAWAPQKERRFKSNLFLGFLLCSFFCFVTLVLLLPISLLLTLPSSSLQTAENGISCCLKGFQGKLKQTRPKISG